MSRVSFSMFLALAIVLASLPAAAGQSQAPAGSVTGVVIAPDGARLPGATITLRNVATDARSVVVTAGHGGYRASGLPAGDYMVEAELLGFDRQVAGPVTVGPSETVTLDFKLSLSALSETVTVVGAAVRETIEASQIRESTARDIGAALGEINGVASVRKAAIANDVSLNGFQSRNLTVLVDGNRIYGACPNGMDPTVFHVDFAEVDHLEVAKGPFDVRHQGSLGGVVNVVTRPPSAGIHLTANMAAGSFGMVNPSVTGSFGNDRVSFLGGYSYRASDPYRDGSGTLFTQYANYKPSTVANKAYEANTGWGRAYISPRANHSAQIAYTGQRTGSVAYPYLQMDGVWDNADRLSASYDIARSSGRVRTLSARAYYSRVEHWMTDALRTSSNGMPRDYSMATQADTTTAGGTVEVGMGSLAAGFEMYRRQWDATTLMAGMKYAPQYGIPFVTIDNTGAFVEYRRPVGQTVRVELGARVDHATSAADPEKANTSLYYAYKNTRDTSAADTGASAKATVVYQATPRLELEGGFGRTFRVPDPQERYFALKRAGSDWVGNPLLEPTTNTGVHAGANYRLHRSMLSGAVYYSQLANFITVHDQARVNAVSGVMNTTARSYANVEARLTTAEFTATWPLTDRLFASANASYTRGTKTPIPALGITSPNVAEIHPLFGSLSLRYDRSVFYAEAQVVASASDHEVDTDLNETPTPAYGVLNLRVGGGRKAWRLMVALDNVFDALYIDPMSYQRDPFRNGVRVREPGRNLYANVAVRF